eukprot:9466834-Pyramimonas_sp.AAC.1
MDANRARTTCSRPLRTRHRLRRLTRGSGGGQEGFGSPGRRSSRRVLLVQLTPPEAAIRENRSGA